MYILEGPLDYALGDETSVLESGDAMLAPSGAKHELANTGIEPGHLMFIFPAANVRRVWL